MTEVVVTSLRRGRIIFSVRYDTFIRSTTEPQIPNGDNINEEYLFQELNAILIRSFALLEKALDDSARTKLRIERLKIKLDELITEEGDIGITERKRGDFALQ
jgi:hypothetical protein